MNLNASQSELRSNIRWLYIESTCYYVLLYLIFITIFIISSIMIKNWIYFLPFPIIFLTFLCIQRLYICYKYTKINIVAEEIIVAEEV